MSENVQIDSFYKYLLANGYYFDKELIENYLLSLKVKPFEILTGNSGTGKTKLAQLFAKFLEDSLHHLVNVPVDENLDYHFVNATTKLRSWGKAKDGVTDKRPGWTLSSNDFRSVLPIDEIEGSYEIEIDGYKSTAEIFSFPQLYYKRDFENFRLYFKELYENEQEQIKEDNENGITHADQKVKLGISYDSLKSAISEEYLESDVLTFQMNITESLLKGSRIDLPKLILDYTPLKGLVPCEITAGGFFAEGTFEMKFRMGKYKTDELMEYLHKLKSDNINTFELKIFGFKPKLDNFTPVSHPIKSYDDYNNHAIIPVGANWTDNSNIVGYHNVITGNYQSTPAYELIKQAQKDPKNPYFLILDEMNLSHVERYFADFLSSIESGEEIPLYGDDKTLKLPNNLFIIGTVNVDETTYMFSPKVLDRANTIEFDTVRAWDYMSSNNNSEDFKGKIEYLQNPLNDSDISNLNIMDLKDIFSGITYEGNSLWDILARELTEFQDALKGSGFDFGFRVINEILRFMVVAWRYDKSPKEWDNWERYFDAQIKQKILPKLHGSEKAIGNVLTNLFNICLEERDNNENPKNFEISKENCRYHTSALKLKSMAKVLSNQRYVSFIN